MQKYLPPAPLLILLMGVAGSGKSTLAHHILRRVWAVYIDNNHIADAFFPDIRSGRSYARLRPHFYQAIYTIVKENLKLGNSVLLDMPHVKEMQDPRWHRFITKLANRSKAQIVVIRCLCSDKTLYARLVHRGEKRDRQKLVQWKEFLKEQPINMDLALPHLNVDTEKTLAANVRAATRYITDGQQSVSGRTRRVRGTKVRQIRSNSQVCTPGTQPSSDSGPRRRKQARVLHGI
jgi:predicted kinase